MKSLTPNNCTKINAGVYSDSHFFNFELKRNNQVGVVPPTLDSLMVKGWPCGLVTCVGMQVPNSV